MTIHVQVFPQLCLADLCKLPALTSLTIIPPHDCWDKARLLGKWLQQQGTFPLLRELRILRCAPDDARPIFACKFLLERLQCLHWNHGSWIGSERCWAEEMQQLVQHTVALKALHIYSPLTPGALDSWMHWGKLPMLSELHLSTDSDGRAKWTDNCFSALAGVSTQLRKFSLNQPVPVTMLTGFAVAFPNITHLRLQFNKDAWRDSLKSLKAVESPSSMILEVLHAPWLPWDNKHALMSNLERFV